MELYSIFFVRSRPPTVGVLKIHSSAVESALSSLQMVISSPAALFDPYAAIAALDEVVNVRKDKKGGRATRF